MNYIITAKHGSEAKYLLVEMTEQELAVMDETLKKHCTHYSINTEQSLNDPQTTEVDSTRGENGKVKLTLDTVPTPATCSFDEAITTIGKA